MADIIVRKDKHDKHIYVIKSSLPILQLYWNDETGPICVNDKCHENIDIRVELIYIYLNTNSDTLTTHKSCSKYMNKHICKIIILYMMFPCTCNNLERYLQK
jgi:hypothetical protein